MWHFMKEGELYLSFMILFYEWSLHIGGIVLKAMLIWVEMSESGIETNFAYFQDMIDQVSICSSWIEV